MNQKLIKDLQPGDSVLSFFIVRKKEVKEKKANHELYITFEFGDKSGRIRGSAWTQIEHLDKTIKPCDIVKVKGKIITFQNRPHITIEKIRKAGQEENITPDDFLPASNEDVEKQFTTLLEIIESVKNQFLNNLLNLLFQDETIKQKYINASAGKLWHHNYAGGLIDHTLSVVKICKFLQTHYPSVNHDMLITSAILHDIGKIDSYDATGFFDYSTEGRLIGHITIGIRIIQAKMNLIDNFPENLKNQLLHCMLSHHGCSENGSPVVPMTLEALLLSHVDDLDSKIGAFFRITEKEKKPGKEWSNYVNLLDRFIYFGNSDSNQND